MGRVQPNPSAQYLDPVLVGDGGVPRAPGQYPTAQDLDGATLHFGAAGDRCVHVVARPGHASAPVQWLTYIPAF